ncbi:hypothetical protein [Angustibacter luteus]|uniref:Terminase large subunit n=1 Tax=Angustibacter luteus TaxID=658456 RepID=A0ABW1JID8_9ACTN
MADVEDWGTPPRFASWPEHETTAASFAIRLAALAHLRLDPWQQFVLEHAMGERADGKWSAFSVGVIVPRQNGKGAIIEAALLADLFTTDYDLIIYSAHQFKTAARTFARLKKLIQRSPELRRRVPEKNFRNSHGEEGLQVVDGPELRFLARSRVSGRGFDKVDKIYLDEALAGLDADDMAAILPTMTEAPNPQIWYLSSSGLHDSHQLTAVRDRGRAGNDPSLAYFEWGNPLGVDLDDPAAVRTALIAGNPSFEIRNMTEEWARNERTETNDDAKWSRERLGVWEDALGGGVISSTEWQALADPPDFDEDTNQPVLGTGSQIPDDVTPTFSIAASLDQSWATIGAAGARHDGRMHGEVADRRRRTSWVVDRAVELQTSNARAVFAIDAGGPAAFLIPDLLDAGIDLRLLSTADYTAACSRFLALVVERLLVHNGDPVLEAAAVAAGKRAIGDRWAWRRANPNVDIDALEAVTIAAHIADIEHEPEYDLLSSFA